MRSSLSRILEALINICLLIPLCSTCHADTKGKLSGKIVEAKNEPIVGANVLIVGTAIGAGADDQGRFVIVNVPVGVYDVRVSAVGYQAKITRGVRLESGQTTTLNVTLAESAVEVGEVTVTAERPLVDTRQTSSVAILGKDDISKLPVQTLTDVVNLQAGHHNVPQPAV